MPVNGNSAVAVNKPKWEKPVLESKEVDPLTIVLIGMKSAGKTVLAGMLGKQGFDVISIDDEIEARMSKSCGAIIADPELDFPRIQRKVVNDIPPDYTANRVISTGGSVGSDRELAKKLGDLGLVVLIKPDAQDLEDRIGPEGIAALNNPKKLTFEELYEERLPAYKAVADYTIVPKSGETIMTTYRRTLKEIIAHSLGVDPKKVSRVKIIKNQTPAHNGDKGLRLRNVGVSGSVARNPGYTNSPGDLAMLAGDNYVTTTMGDIANKLADKLKLGLDEVLEYMGITKEEFNDRQTYTFEEFAEIWHNRKEERIAALEDGLMVEVRRLQEVVDTVMSGFTNRVGEIGDPQLLGAAGDQSTVHKVAEQYGINSPEYVVAHAARQASRGKKPSVRYKGIVNPAKALEAAKADIELKKKSLGDDYVEKLNALRDDANDSGVSISLDEFIATMLSTRITGVYNIDGSSNLKAFLKSKELEATPTPSLGGPRLNGLRGIITHGNPDDYESELAQHWVRSLDFAIESYMRYISERVWFGDFDDVPSSQIIVGRELFTIFKQELKDLYNVLSDYRKSEEAKFEIIADLWKAPALKDSPIVTGVGAQ